MQSMPSRLPTLPRVGHQLADESNPCQVPTATSRYRNDPYRAVVTMAPTQATPSPPPEPLEKLAPAPRRGQLLRPAASSLPVLGNPQPPRGSRRSSFVRSSDASSATQGVAEPAQGTNAAAADRKGASKIALIQFKRTMMSAIYDTAALPQLAVGDTVIVEGDRGEHIATIARLNVRKSKSTPTLILRHATPADLDLHKRVTEDERIALETCRAHASRLGLDSVMQVVDVEFQLDFQKLTVFFEPRDPSSFVDFRSLQRVLYQHFRCRIWIVDC